MPQGLQLIIVAVLALIVGAAMGYFLQRPRVEAVQQAARKEAERLREEARAQAKEILLKAKDEAQREREQAEKEIRRMRAELQQEEDRLIRRRNDLDQRVERLEQREQALNKRQSALDRKANELEKLEAARIAELERIAQLSRDEAKQILLEAVEKEARQDMANVIRQVEEETKAQADAIARKIITMAIQRVASDQVAEVAVSVVPLPNDEMKGRIIGRNGRNIRAFEQVAGVDIIVDDTPEAVTLSSFDPVRREIARRAMTRLVMDGRIHPARIEKSVEDARQEVEQIIREEGERAVYETGVTGLHPEIIKLLGRLKFRTSYGQNQLQHAIEVAHIAGIIAAELGADVQVAKAGALLHDIGKAVDHEVEGTHAMIGAEICRRYGVNPKVVNCIASHHHEVEQESLEAIIVEAADAISGARPGARRESIETYLKRVKALEEIAHSFPGVSQAYALQAGREVRIVVVPEQVDDLAAIQLAKNVAKKIEESMEYPGQIKVTVLRETRAVDYAK
uniref:RNA binding metal dependent phosphohydrolase n=1 Tax=uncultured prokaryote TaxID=198431 RepID=H5SKR8_9ZZZZ|nr:RNA binding metal dependent phosphohydrolase [uncultured prokaryote]